jgi:glycosyltransferase involved in cell wall biosynthesis
MKVAIVHDWLTGMRGGEKVLEVFCELYPRADLYCLFHIPGRVSETIERMKIRTSFIQRLPFLQTRYRWYLPLFPAAVERFNLSRYDLVISSSHCVAKGAVTAPDACHISYVYTPMRYMWDLYEDYFGKGRAGFLTRRLVPLFAARLRAWDVSSSARVDSFVAISEHIAARIGKYYRRKAAVIYPPVDTERFRPSGRAPEGFYLVVSALVPYKRVDLAVEAFNSLGAQLRVIGTGPEEKKLRKLANSNVKFLGYQSDEIVAQHYADCRALIFPGKEDFGIVPVEAMASGRPVIAYGRGGARETVVLLAAGAPGRTPTSPTGILFEEQSAGALCEAVMLFERNSHKFDPAAMRQHSLKFDRGIFKKNIAQYIEKEYQRLKGSDRSDLNLPQRHRGHREHRKEEKE